MGYYRLIVLLFVMMGLLSSCSNRRAKPKKVSRVSYVAKEVFILGEKSFASNGTLDFEDAIRDKCSQFPQDSYRYQHNNNYRNGWIEASKKC